MKKYPSWKPPKEPMIDRKCIKMSLESLKLLNATVERDNLNPHREEVDPDYVYSSSPKGSTDKASDDGMKDKGSSDKASEDSLMDELGGIERADDAEQASDDSQDELLPAPPGKVWKKVWKEPREVLANEVELATFQKIVRKETMVYGTGVIRWTSWWTPKMRTVKVQACSVFTSFCAFHCVIT
jgi:hypothetical protein